MKLLKKLARWVKSLYRKTKKRVKDMAFGLEVYNAGGSPIFVVGRKYYKEMGSYVIPALSHTVPYGQRLDWFNANFRHSVTVAAPAGGTLWARSLGGSAVSALDIEGSTIVCYPEVDYCSGSVCRTKPVKILWGVYQ